MIDKEIAKKQILRLGQMVAFPRDNAEALKELVLAVQAARDEEQAREAISAMLDTAVSDTRCPMPAEIRRWIYERQEAEGTEARRRTAGCPHCNGTGHVIVEQGGYTGAKLCECRKVAV